MNLANRIHNFIQKLMKSPLIDAYFHLLNYSSTILIEETAKIVENKLIYHPKKISSSRGSGTKARKIDIWRVFIFYRSASVSHNKKDKKTVFIPSFYKTQREKKTLPSFSSADRNDNNKYVAFKIIFPR